jgi:Flp pilus assembly protein TadD
MPPNSEIEKLERRWNENPKGTVFAPFAEVLRKHGDYPRAKDILRQGLELHPDHIPGNIVLGRCCLDLGEEGPAEAAFVHVLELDSENVIALKALADITERQGRLMEAASWLSRLITVDPSNDEAREQRARVEKAREAASAAIVEPIVAAPVSEIEKTAVVEVIQPPTPKSLDLPATEIGAGEIGGVVEDAGPLTIDADAAVEAALGAFDAPAPPMPVDPGSEITVRVAARARPESAPSGPDVPASVLDLEPAALDLTARAKGLEPSALTELTRDESFQPPAEPVPPEATMSTYALGVEDSSSIEIRPSAASEFQSPDDSAALFDLSIERSSEFQQPDASQELKLLERSGSEYQTPSGAEELLKAVEKEAPPEPEPAPASGQIPTSGFAAITLMATEEIPTEPAAAEPPALFEIPIEDGAVPAAPEPAEAVSVVEMLTAASTVSAAAPAAEPEIEPASESAPIDAARATQDLPLIFPDEVHAPEPPKIRRISDEVLESAPPAPVETPAGEPAPVLTESMAELYARQGHLAEAVNVFRVLAGRMPTDARIAARLRELEDLQAAGRRRMSYVAVDTGGESVESFFRNLSDARPGTGQPGPSSLDTAPTAAPTRPATDPLSLSAIFGEEAGSGRVSAPNEAPPPPPASDSFSFDQFFAGGGAPTGTGPRPAMPPDEDLDQFQNWLKSLKR